ncbi:MAG: Ribosomal large subunit pseudouridine synthase, partial [Actinomycetota bacterium]
METRSTPVPDGLDGVRVDAGLARLFGFSRAQAAEMAEAGGVTLDGVTLGKSDKLKAGGFLSVEWEEKRGPEIVPMMVP